MWSKASKTHIASKDAGARRNSSPSSVSVSSAWYVASTDTIHTQEIQSQN